MTDREALILLNMIEGLGPKKIEKLLSYLDRASSIFTMKDAELKKFLGQVLSAAIIKKRESLQYFKELKLIEKHNIEILTILDRDYPPLLKEIYDPPAVLYVKGNKDCLAKNCLAIVGSRKASLYGLNASQKFSYSLASLGFVIVSGLAYGIDTSAHKGALKAKACTCAVLGSGLLHIYPKENSTLATQIVKRGCVISEFPLESSPRKENFPRRNRIISGLSQGTLVVEAAQKSGALITANFALEQSREVFCLPGCIDSPQSRGVHSFIKQGARLVDSVEDILDELSIKTKS